jgi:hypothetical protein
MTLPLPFQWGETTSAVAKEPRVVQGWYSSTANLIVTKPSLPAANERLPTPALPTVSERSPTMETVIANETLVDSFSRLMKGWNGYSAEPIPKIVIDRVRRALRMIDVQPPEIFPTGRETIQFEYSHAARALEIEIGRERIGFLLEDGDDCVEWESTSLGSINNALKQLYAAK